MYLSTVYPSCSTDAIHAPGVAMGETQSQAGESGSSRDECHVRHGYNSIGRDMMLIRIIEYINVLFHETMLIDW